MRTPTTPSAAPTFSVSDSGSYSICRLTLVVLSSSRWKVTTPPCDVPSSVSPVVCQAIRSSGCCSVISASNSRLTPAILVTQWVRVGVSWLIFSTPSMKAGNDSNWVHWL